MTGMTASASEINLKVPALELGTFKYMPGINGFVLMVIGLLLTAVTLGISIYLFNQIKKLEVHKRMADVANII